MKNVYQTPLRYKNFARVEKSTQLHFHITPREFADWMIANPREADELTSTFGEVQSEMEANSDSEATTEQKLAMLRMVKVLAELSAGKPSDDGEYFEKNDRFKYSAAYDAFRLFLFENPKELTQFIQTLLSEEVVSEFAARMTAVDAPQGDGKPSLKGPKDPTQMSHEELVALSHEELVAAMRERNKQQ